MTPVPLKIDLTDEQRRRIAELATSEGKTMAEVIGRALDWYLEAREHTLVALETTFGAAKDFDGPSRDEWRDD